MRKFRLSALIISFCLLLSACGSIPNLTKEENQMVSEYAASLMLKYDSANHTRLVDTSDFLESYYAAKKAHDDAERAYYDAIAREEEQRRREAQAQKDANEAYNSSQSTSGSSSSGGSGNNGTGGATVIDNRFQNMTIGEFLGYDNFSIQYAGYSLLDNYPEDGESYGISMSATKGKKILAVYFSAKNESDSSATLDIYHMTAAFRLSVNGGNYVRTYETLLGDVLSEYIGEFAGKETKKLSLIIEVADSTVVENLGLSITTAAGTYTKTLK